MIWSASLLIPLLLLGSFMLGGASLWGTSPVTSLGRGVLQPLAAEGAWAAYAHQTEGVPYPDVCIMASHSVGLRIDAGFHLTLSLIDPTWRLPAVLSGTLSVAIDQYRLRLPMVADSATMLSAPLRLDELAALLAAMRQGSHMALSPAAPEAAPQAFGALARSVSLRGAATVMAAFRQCAGLHDR